MSRAAVTLLLVALAGTGAAEGVRPAALEPASSGGIATVDRALAKLSVHARLLIVGAHPDDEDNATLTWVSRGLGGEAAYLSLSRGEGGQNLIGPELGDALGVIRTGELLAAREIEGTRQYFARAFDFGYTRSLDETLERWPRAVLLEDAIRAARRFKPQVIVAIFPPDARAGHGQHQLSAVMAREIFERAGDPALLSGLGLPPWRPRALYKLAWSRDEATLGFDLGVLEPIDGRSLGQIAADGRSQHRSQDMGRTQPLGSWPAGLMWLAGVGEGGGEIFAGVDTRLAAIASGLDAGAARDEIARRLARVEALARETRQRLSPAALDDAAPAFVEILAELDAATALLGDSPAEVAVGDLLAEKRTAAAHGLAAAAGVVIDAVADRESAAQGSTVGITASVWSAGDVRADVGSVRLVDVGELVTRAAGGPDQERGVTSWSFDLEVPRDARPTEPYYLERPRLGDLYDWDTARESVRGLADRPSLSVRFDLEIAGADIELTRQVVHRYGDQAVGEVRRPFRIVPRVEVELRPALSVVPLQHEGAVRLDLRISSNVETPVEGELVVKLPDGWRASGPAAWSIAEPRGAVAIALELEPVAAATPGLVSVTVAAHADGDRYAAAYPLLEYPHITPTALRVAARGEIRWLDLSLPALERIGYVRGASDRVPEALLDVGLPVELLTAADLRERDLSDYDVVVVGSRAYETEPALRRANPRLLEYVRAGGALIVQYQQYQFVNGGYAPLPLDIERPHGRVTDEASSVTVLEGDHAVFRSPNVIGPADWDGWVQERGLYFAGDWDPAFTPLLALRDPEGQPEQRGSLLVAEVGEGVYVYTGLSFFRQLPAGVPGAFRLFTNLLALGAR